MRPRSDDDNPPSCFYYPDKECTRPARCPVHRPVTQRKRKLLHYLRPDLTPCRWDPDGKKSTRLFWRTYCGLFMPRRLNFEAFLDSFFGDPEVKKLTKEEQWRLEFDRRQKLEFDGWQHPPIPSKDPAYEVFFLSGWGKAEVLVATKRATCGRCLEMRKRRRFLTIARPSTTFDPL